MGALCQSRKASIWAASSCFPQTLTTAPHIGTCAFYSFLPHFLFSPALACISAFPHTPTPSTLHVNGDIQREHARIVRNACILRIPSRIQAGWTGFWAAALSSCILRNLMKWFEFCYKGNSVPGVGGEHLCREAAGRVSLGGLSRRPAFHSLG